MATTMLPSPDLLVAPDPVSRIAPNGRPDRELREELRRIPTARNVVSVVSAWAQTIGVLALAIWIDHPVAWVVAFLLMGRSNVLLAILSHEAAHRLLFTNRRWNDTVGRWLLGYPVFLPIDLYRRGHMNHHRDEFGPNEPDIPLYRGYPIKRDSMRRKLTRDALGVTGVRLMKGLLRGVRSSDAAVRNEAWRIVATQAVIAGIFVAVGWWYLYPLLWVLPHLTVWRVLNRLRSIAEHGGMIRSDDRRQTTHSVRQSWIGRLVFVPYNTGWHLAHHVDSGIPWRNLPAFHAELVRAGYVQPDLEHPGYLALWCRLASG
jgi:fatty acid desaturase